MTSHKKHTKENSGPSEAAKDLENQLSICTHMQKSIETKQRILADDDFLLKLEKAIQCLCHCFSNKHKLLIAGNGGSAADAQHFSAELVCRYRRERIGLPAIALTTDTSAVTAWSNDYDYSTYFERALQALGQAHDVFVGISTSGQSPSIVKALKAAKTHKMPTIALLGKDGGEAAKHADISLIVPAKETPLIQESHIMLIHILCEEVESRLINVLTGAEKLSNSDRE